MSRMRITFKCHNGKCKKPIDETMARLCVIYWYYCSTECAKEDGAIKIIKK